jgi:hypothetical protein
MRAVVTIFCNMQMILKPGRGGSSLSESRMSDLEPSETDGDFAIGRIRLGTFPFYETNECGVSSKRINPYSSNQTIVKKRKVAHIRSIMQNLKKAYFIYN